jgi:hypothetical protein
MNGDLFWELDLVDHFWNLMLWHYDSLKVAEEEMVCRKNRSTTKHSTRGTGLPQALLEIYTTSQGQSCGFWYMSLHLL